MREERLIHLGPFLVDEYGRLRPRDRQETANFSLRWRGRRFQARLSVPQPDADSSGALALDVVLGRVPSTAGPQAGTRPERRDAVFAMLPHLRGAMPDHWQLTLHPDHSIGLSTTTMLALPTSAGSLLAALTTFLLECDPTMLVLDAMESSLEAASCGGLLAQKTLPNGHRRPHRARRSTV